MSETKRESNTPNQPPAESYAEKLRRAKEYLQQRKNQPPLRGRKQ